MLLYLSLWLSLDLICVEVCYNTHSSIKQSKFANYTWKVIIYRYYMVFSSAIWHILANKLFYMNHDKLMFLIPFWGIVSHFEMHALGNRNMSQVHDIHSWPLKSSASAFAQGGCSFTQYFLWQYKIHWFIRNHITFPSGFLP